MGGCPSSSLEIDVYLGFKRGFAGGDWNYDFGYLRYNYPGNYPGMYAAWGVVKPNTDELYAALGYKWLTAKISYALGDTFGFDDASGSYYAELNAAVPLGGSGFTLGAHVGYQKFKGGMGGVAAGTYAAAGFDNGAWSYYDWKIGLNKEIAGLNWGLALKGTDTDGQRVGADGVTYNIWQNPYGNNLGDSQVVLSVQKTF